MIKLKEECYKYHLVKHFQYNDRLIIVDDIGKVYFSIVYCSDPWNPNLLWIPGRC